nr:unnamed protein product [Callosobruchus chinensis]
MTVTQWTLPCTLPRADRVLLHRLRIGHTALTHSYLLPNNPPNCSLCSIRLTISHVIRECPSLHHLRQLSKYPMTYLVASVTLSTLKAFCCTSKS